MTATPAMSATPSSTPEGRREPDLSGRRIGDYQLLRRLGSGGMAEVYLAEQLSLRRQVALKVLKKNLAGDEAYIRRFQHEAQAAAKLVHANIVQIYEVGCIDGTYFISQEYVPGQNLKQILTKLGHGVDAVQAVNIIRQVAAALHKAAEQKIIHRDIKPENIMIAPSGEVKVADFGLARVARDGEDLNLTQVGITMGTPLYMSPEQVEGRPVVDTRSDLYSLGVTSYHMLAGRPPFDGDTALAVALQHLNNPPSRLEGLRKDLPEGLCRVVHRMLAKKPEDRYQRPIDLLKDLRTLKIEGLDQDWTADLPGFNSADLALSTAGRLEATQQLDRILRSGMQRIPRRWSLASLAWTIVGLLLVGVVAGSALAWINRPPHLLEVSRSVHSQVKKCATVREQFVQAQFATHNQEAEWKAVWEYFPPEASAENERYARKAMRNLASLYLSRQQWQDALKLYEKLSKVESAEADFRLAGEAGLAVAYDKLGKEEESREHLKEVAEAAEGGVNLKEKLGEHLFKEVDTLLQPFRE